MRISDWSSDVCSSDLPGQAVLDLLHLLGDVEVDRRRRVERVEAAHHFIQCLRSDRAQGVRRHADAHLRVAFMRRLKCLNDAQQTAGIVEETPLPLARLLGPEATIAVERSEEHTSEL